MHIRQLPWPEWESVRTPRCDHHWRERGRLACDHSASPAPTSSAMAYLSSQSGLRPCWSWRSGGSCCCVSGWSFGAEHVVDCDDGTPLRVGREGQGEAEPKALEVVTR
jgi:hypothetical protein